MTYKRVGQNNGHYPYLTPVRAPWVVLPRWVILLAAFLFVGAVLYAITWLAMAL